MPQTVKQVSNTTLGQHLGATKDAFFSIINGNFDDHIKNGDLVIVEPNLAPKNGDLVITDNGQGQSLEYYYVPPQIRLVPKGATGRSWKQTRAQEDKKTTLDCCGVVIGVLKPRRTTNPTVN